MESRHKIAKSIRSNGKQSKVIHYLGGQSTKTPFENLFPASRRTTFVRYERDLCEVPFNYTQAEWVEDNGLIEKQSHQFGYFVNSDFFEEAWDFVDIFAEHENYYWLDFCGMPTEELLEKIYDCFFSPDAQLECNKEIYLTFYLNARGIKFVSSLMNKYGKSMEDRAKSLCDSLKEKFNVDNYDFSVFDVYVNGASPMAVIKIKQQ